MKPRFLRVTRKGTEATNCRSLTHPIGLLFLTGLKRSGTETRASEQWMMKDQRVEIAK